MFGNMTLWFRSRPPAFGADGPHKSGRVRQPTAVACIVSGLASVSLPLLVVAERSSDYPPVVGGGFHLTLLLGCPPPPKVGNVFFWVSFYAQCGVWTYSFQRSPAKLERGVAQTWFSYPFVSAFRVRLIFPLRCPTDRGAAESLFLGRALDPVNTSIAMKSGLPLWLAPYLPALPLTLFFLQGPSDRYTCQSALISTFFYFFLHRAIHWGGYLLCD